MAQHLAYETLKRLVETPQQVVGSMMAYKDSRNLDPIPLHALTSKPFDWELFARMPRDEMLQRLERAGIPFAPINRPADLTDDPHLNSNGGLVDVTLTEGSNAGEQIKLPAIPLEMDHRKFGLRFDLPQEGIHTVDVLREIGYSEEEVQSMLKRGLARSA